MDPFTMVAPTASADGYGCSAEYLVLAATREHGADIELIEWDWRDSRYTDPELLSMRVPAHPSYYRDIMVVYFLPFALSRFHSRQTIGMSMWETDRLPDAWARAAQIADSFIVPCEHSRQVFQQRVACPVEVVPFGTDTDFYTLPAETHRAKVPGDTRCRFLMAGLLHYRKGVDLALRAFQEEFRRDESVSLTLKTRRNFLDPVSEMQRLGDPRITVVDTDYTREQMRDLYWDHDCLLSPSRGEGSGLTPRDAMATGLPAILTDWSGLSELADPRYSYPVEVEALEPAPLDCSSYSSGVTGGGPIGNFARPSVSQLREAMREVYENPEGARIRGLAAADWMRRCWSWEHCAWHWMRALERLTASYATA